MNLHLSSTDDPLWTEALAYSPCHLCQTFRMKRNHIYLLLALIGALIPYFHFGPWLLEHGLDMRLFFRQVHANRVSEFFAADVVVSAAVVLIFLIYERRKLHGLWWVPLLALLIFGVSVSLPVLLYLRDGNTSANQVDIQKIAPVP
jgi:hypothetical protein